MAGSKDYAGTGVHVGKLKCYGDGGAECTVEVAPGSANHQKKEYSFYVSGGAKNMSQAQMDAYQRAKLKADPTNGGDIRTAKPILEAAGFKVYWA